jgi:superfamily II DNA/RNA helicase
LSSHVPSSPQKRRGRRRPPRRTERPRVLVRAEPSELAYEPSAFDPAPIPFDKLSLDDRLISGVRDLGWSETRPVQSGVIPLALDGHDVIACAETGTGKTAAFLLPILQRFLKEQPPVPQRTRTLVLAPTRELVVQIEDQVQGLTYHTTV